jgi:hypothetical protein
MAFGHTARSLGPVSMVAMQGSAAGRGELSGKPGANVGLACDENGLLTFFIFILTRLAR